MRRLLTVLVFVSPAMAGEPDDAQVPAKTIPAIALLPDGSELKGVMLPRYDKNHKLVGVLKSETMTLVNDGQIDSTKVSIEFFNPNQSPKARIDLARATFYQVKGLIAAREPVEIKSDRLTASGSGLYYSFKQGEGFLLGPATTTILPAPTETTMNRPISPLRATTLLGMSLLTQSLLAAPPPLVTDAEKAALQTDSVSMAPAAAKAGAGARASLETDLADAAAASKAATTFLAQADIPAIPADPVPAPDKPLEFKPGTGDTVIHCEGGMYFDPDEGVLVYLKNVTVKDPRFDLTGANELKVFLEKKPENEEKKDKPDKDKSAMGGKIGASFGAVERIVATGVIKIEQKAANGEEAIQASGAIFSYNIKADQIIISGGYPWVIRGANRLRATSLDCLLKISPKGGQMRTEGVWDTMLNLEQKK